mgnify:CR=1 FL=1
MDRLEHSSHVCVSLQRSRRMHAFDFLCDDTPKSNIVQGVKCLRLFFQISEVLFVDASAAARPRSTAMEVLNSGSFVSTQAVETQSFTRSTTSFRSRRIPTESRHEPRSTARGDSTSSFRSEACSENSSPSGRLHPHRDRRAALRMADPWTDISYYAASRASCEQANETSLGGGFQYGLASGPSGSFTLQSARQTDTQGWVPNQAWLESLRYYPPEEEDAEFANTGCTHGRQVPHHLENGVRLRSGLAAADPEWRTTQLQECWAPESALRHGLRFNDIQPAILPPPAPVTAQGRIATGSFRHTGSYDDDDSALPSADEPLSYSSRWDSPSARKEVSKEAWSGRAYDRAQGLPTSTCMSVLQKADSQQWRGLPPGEAQSQVEAVGTNTHTNDANINDARRPRHRMMVLAAPKRRTSQDHHLHEWEIKSRKKDYAHLRAWMRPSLIQPYSPARSVLAPCYTPCYTP